MKRNILIGGAWPYANYYLHIGHLAALLPGDVLARYFRGNHDNVLYVSGSDCHGTPITERAKKEETTAENIATFYHEEFKKTFEKLEFTYDEYSATMYPQHKKYVQKVFKQMIDNGYIYEKEIDQDFCNKCNTFISDREIEGICPHCGGYATGDQCDECLASLDSNEVIDKRCKTCKEVPITKTNKHLYFKLSAFQKDLEDLVESHKDDWRKNAYGESLKFLNLGLIDRAATRQLDWGVEVPIEGYDDKRIYVWIEAVLGYLSVATKVADERGIDIDKFLDKNDDNNIMYLVHGKDNIVFHSIIFPAIILSLKNNYRLVDYMISSAYVNLNEEKMSKSKGNLLTVNELLDIFTVDSLRFNILYNGPETKDTNCSIEDMKTNHNKFLVGVIGNFVNRNLSFVNKKFDGIIKEAKINEDIIKLTKDIYPKVSKFMEIGEFKNALTAIIEYVSEGNKYYDNETPWIHAKENVDKFWEITYTCTYMMANIANLIYPFTPNASKKIKEMLSLSSFAWEEEMIKGDITIKELSLLFERME